MRLSAPHWRSLLRVRTADSPSVHWADRGAPSSVLHGSAWTTLPAQWSSPERGVDRALSDRVPTAARSRDAKPPAEDGHAGQRPRATAWLGETGDRGCVGPGLDRCVASPAGIGRRAGWLRTCRCELADVLRVGRRARAGRRTGAGRHVRAGWCAVRAGWYARAGWRALRAGRHAQTARHTPRSGQHTQPTGRRSPEGVRRRELAGSANAAGQEVA